MKSVKAKSEMTPAERLKNSRIIGIVAGICCVVYFVWFLAIEKKAMDINMMNFLLFTIGLILHGSPMSFLKTTKESVKSSAGIIV